jgi:hypothetical protein
MAHELPPLPTHRLENIIAAYRGIAGLVDPDSVLNTEDRSNLYFLITLLTEHLDTVMHEFMRHSATLHEALRQAQADRPQEGAPHAAQ